MRVPRWEMLLDAYIVERQGKPFAWGTNDCATFAAEWVKRARGEALFEAAHDDAASAAAEIASRGGLDAAVTALLGLPLVTPLLAQRGDVALADIGGRQSLVVVIDYRAVGPGESGLNAVFVSDDLVMAWRV